MRALATLGALCALGAVLATTLGTRPAAAQPKAHATRALLAGIDHYRDVTWHWQRVMGLPTTRTAMSARTSPDLAYRRWVLRLWRRRAAHAEARASRWLVQRTQAYRRTVAYWQDVMGVRRTPTRHTAAASESLAYRAWVYRLWRNRAQTILRKAKNPPYESQWLCIHRYEGSWQDSGAPYWGGLQMSLTFQQRYGGFLLQKKGTADHWTPLEQMWVAARAVRSGRGFYPWPRTARMCGLI